MLKEIKLNGHMNPAIVVETAIDNAFNTRVSKANLIENNRKQFTKNLCS